MTLRRGLMMTMANGVRNSSGVIEIEDSSSTTMTIPHGLGTSKVLVLAQLIDEDHANINAPAGSRYKAVIVCGFTKTEENVDTQQTYSYNNGNQLSYPNSSFVVFGDFPAATGTSLSLSFQESTYGLFNVDGNSAEFNMGHPFMQGRWVWTAYAIG